MKVAVNRYLLSTDCDEVDREELGAGFRDKMKHIKKKRN